MKKLDITAIMKSIIPWLMAAIDYLCVCSVMEEIFNENPIFSEFLGLTIAICLDVIPSFGAAALNPLELKENFKWARFKFLLSMSVFMIAFLAYSTFTVITVREKWTTDPVESMGMLVLTLIPISTSISAFVCGMRDDTDANIIALERDQELDRIKLGESEATVHRMESQLSHFHPQRIDDQMYEAAVDRELSSMSRAFWRIHVELCKALQTTPEGCEQILQSEQTVKARISEIRASTRCAPTDAAALPKANQQNGTDTNSISTTAGDQSATTQTLPISA